MKLYRPEPWMAEGACNFVDPELWFPDKGGPVKDAKRICRQCPVVDKCLEFALEHAERYGVYGGKSEMERRKILKQRQVAA